MEGSVRLLWFIFKTNVTLILAFLESMPAATQAIVSEYPHALVIGLIVCPRSLKEPSGPSLFQDPQTILRSLDDFKNANSESRILQDVGVLKIFTVHLV